MGGFVGFLFILLSLAIGGVAGYLLRSKFVERKLAKARDIAFHILENARVEAEAEKKRILLEAKDALFQARAELEAESKERRAEILKIEDRVAQKEANLDRKEVLLGKREAELNTAVQNVDKQLQRLEKEKERHTLLVQQQQQKLPGRHLQIMTV